MYFFFSISSAVRMCYGHVLLTIFRTVILGNFLVSITNNSKLNHNTSRCEMTFNLLGKKKQMRSKERPTQQGSKSTNKTIYLTLLVFLFFFLSKCRSWAVWIWKLTRGVEDGTRNRRRKRRKKRRFQRQLKTRNEDKKMGTEHAKHIRSARKFFYTTCSNTHTHVHIYIHKFAARGI